MTNGGGGECVSRFFVPIFLSHCTENFITGKLPGLRKILVSKKNMNKMGGVYHLPTAKIFCPTVPKNFFGETLNVSEKLGYRKVLCIRKGYHDVSSEVFCFITKKLRRWTLMCFRKFRVTKHLMSKRAWVIMVFWLKFFVSQCPKSSLRTPSAFQKL